MKSTIDVSQDQVEFFKAQGYLPIDAITTQEEISWMRDVYDELFANRVGREEGMEFDLAGTDEDDAQEALPQILDPLRYAKSFRDTLYVANALAITKQLLGQDAEYHGSHAILKPARYGSTTPWHQDEAYWNPGVIFHSLSVWMPLQEVTPENGCMEFIPGSHHLDVLPHHHVNHDPRIHALEVDDGHMDASKAVACPLPAGGATFHYSRTLHYTAPNRSDAPRRALILGFGTPARKLDQPRDFYWQRETDTLAAKKREEAAKRKVGAQSQGIVGDV